MENANARNTSMVPIPLSEFVPGMISPVNLFILLETGRELLLIKAGSPFDESQLNKYREKKVESLWVTRPDFEALAAQPYDPTKTGISKAFLESIKKLFFVSKAVKTVHQSFQAIGIQIESYDQALAVSDATMQMANEDPNIQSMLSTLHSLDDHLSSHSVAVSVLSVCIASEMAIVTKSNLQAVSLGGLLHDIGMKQLPKELLDIPQHKMTHDELQVYRSHPQLGAEMLKGLNLNTETLTSIIFQHHERMNGLGYPLGAKGPRIHPLAKIVGLASEFANVVMPNPKHGNQALNTRDALNTIQGSMGQPFDKIAFAALSRIVNK